MPAMVGQSVTSEWTPLASSTGTVAVAVKLPDGTTLAPAATVTEATGTYTVTFTADQPGLYKLTWSRGITAMFADVLPVWPEDPRYLVSVSSAKSQVGGNASLDDLAPYIATATWVIEKLVGAVLPEAATHVADGGVTAINLPSVGVTVDAVTVNDNVLDASSYKVDQVAGVVRVKSGRFADGVLNVEIDYNVGSAVVPQNLQLAALELIRHLWASSRRGGSATNPRPAADTVQTPFGFAIPRRVDELCQVAVHTPGFA